MTNSTVSEGPLEARLVWPMPSLATVEIAIY